MLPQQKEELIENLRTKISTLAKEVIGEDGTDSDKQLLQKLTDSEKSVMKQFIGVELLHGGAKSEGGGSAGFAGASAGVADLDKEASRKSGTELQTAVKNSSAPPSNYLFVQQNTEKPANDQFKPGFLTKIKSTVGDGLGYLKREIANDISLNKVLDLFIESQDKTLRDLNSQFGQSDEESNIEKELQKAFEKFKQDFTSTQTTASQFIQTTQSTQYQQEVQKLQESIEKGNLTSDQQNKLGALATQNNQKDLAEKLQNNSKTLTTPQKEQLIKLVQQDLFTKQESQLVPKITKAIIANDNQPIVSELTKEQVFQQVADKLQPLKIIQEETKQEVLTGLITKLDEKTLDPATKQIITELKTELQKATSAPAQQQILVKFLAKQSPKIQQQVLENLELTVKEDSLTEQQQEERRNFFNEVKKETTKQEVLEKFVNHKLDEKTPDYAIIEPIIKQLKQELQTTTSATAKQQILVQFLAKKDIPQQAKDEVLQILESTETKDSPQQQARQDFINEVKIATLTTQLQDININTSTKQQVLAQFLAKQSPKIQQQALENLELTEKEDSLTTQQQEERRNFFNEVKKELTKEQVFQQVADKLQPLKIIQEETKQEVLTGLITKLDEKTLDPATKQIITELKTELQKATSAPAQQQILVKFLAKQSPKIQQQVLENLELTVKEDSLTEQQQEERRNFFNEVKKETTKQEVLEKFVNHKLDEKTPDYAIIEPIIKQLKQELQTTTSATAKQQILVQFLAKKDIPQQAKDEVLQILESTETKDSPQQQARQDFINEVKIATLTTQLQDININTSTKQQILVQFLANRTNSSITAEVETVLQKIKKEEKEEEIKSPPEQERTDFVRKIEEQSDAIKTFTQHRNPEPESGEISQEEIETLKKSKVLKVLDIKAEDLEYLTDRAGSDSEVDKILKDFSLYVNDDDDYFKQTLSKISTQDKQKLQDDAEKTVQFLTEISQEPSSVETGSQVDLSISVESIETQKKNFDAVLKLFGVKYKSDRNKYSSIIFSTADLKLSMDEKMENMYVNLEKPLDKIKKYDDLLEKILTAINEDLEKATKTVGETTEKNQLQILKNKNTIQKLKNRKKSLKSLFARIKKAITQS